MSAESVVPIKIVIRLETIDNEQDAPELISSIEFPAWDDIWYTLGYGGNISKITHRQADDFIVHWESLAGDIGVGFEVSEQVRDWISEIVQGLR